MALYNSPTVGSYEAVVSNERGTPVLAFCNVPGFVQAEGVTKKITRSTSTTTRRFISKNASISSCPAHENHCNNALYCSFQDATVQQFSVVGTSSQGYLAHKKQPPPRTP
jgi:hypothetical protein